MARIDDLLAALDERRIATAVSVPHDEARIRYRLRSNTVSSYGEYGAVLADYYNHHFTACVAHGGRLTPADARQLALGILEREYRRRGGDRIQAYNDAQEGLNGALRTQLDHICESLKADATERYIQEIFDQYVAPVSWDDRVEIIRQFIQRCGPNLSSAVDRDHPERYAQNHHELIRSYVEGLRRTSSIFRRL
ncbi:MAG TPA: hypothetical protein PKY77_26200 [Phycisphaerae bacterium]|nr:hypothetical protein [Phycisphaerae bacterium]HRY67691.1 hypothetical protein [Phycisphaerae bacterium]HSA25142.1 hypothetical protein [Phycisphaerae bacterium]